jgi:hypothetical protein
MLSLVDFVLYFTHGASRQRDKLEKDRALEKRWKAVKKTLGLLQTNPRRPSLQSEYATLKGPNGEKVFEAYAEHKTPAAFRIFWYYGPKKGDITIVAITPASVEIRLVTFHKRIRKTLGMLRLCSA